MSSLKKYLITLLILSWVMTLTVSLHAQGVIVAAGGGAEGDIGVTESWSYKLYKKLIENGDTNSDGIIKVAILTASSGDTVFLNSYFRWIGETMSVSVYAKTFLLDTKVKANNAAMVGEIGDYDVIFLKGGDQGVYYDEWNGTLLKTKINEVLDRNGGIGGTSAGAMSLSQYSFSGGKDLISTDVLTNSATPYLEDASEGTGSSGIHTDFLPLIPNIVIDTHVGERGRLGRTIGILAKISQDFQTKEVLGVGIDRKTGIAVKNGKAEVIGEESVFFVRPTEPSVLKRDAGRPLFFTHLKLDHLTEGWIFDLSKQRTETEIVPAGAEEIMWDDDDIRVTKETMDSLTVSGSSAADQSKFGGAISIYPNPFSVEFSVEDNYLQYMLGFTEAGNSSTRGDKQESLFRALYSHSKLFKGLLLFPGGSVVRPSENYNRLYFSSEGQKPSASILLNSATAEYKSLSPYNSYFTGSAKNAGLVGITVHVLAESYAADRNFYFDWIDGQLYGPLFVSVVNQELQKIQSFSVGKPYPNPFNPMVRFNIAGSFRGKVEVKVYDVTGKLMRTYDFQKSAEENDFSMDLSACASGLYLVRFGNGTFWQTEKITLIK